MIPKPNSVFTDKELYEKFQVANMGGIRVSRKNNCILLIDSSIIYKKLESFSNNIYEKEGFVIYTGNGENDQELTRTNYALYDSRIQKNIVLYFEKNADTQYVYRFRVQYVTYYKCKEKNDSGKSRRVIKFVLKILDDET